MPCPALPCLLPRPSWSLACLLPLLLCMSLLLQAPCCSKLGGVHPHAVSVMHVCRTLRLRAQPPAGEHARDRYVSSKRRAWQRDISGRHGREYRQQDARCIPAAGRAVGKGQAVSTAAGAATAAKTDRERSSDSSSLNNISSHNRTAQGRAMRKAAKGPALACHSTMERRKITELKMSSGCCTSGMRMYNNTPVPWADLCLPLRQCRSMRQLGSHRASRSGRYAACT
jgi:hypothetical protein